MSGLSPSRQQMTVLLTVLSPMPPLRPHSYFLLGSYHRTRFKKKRPDYVGPFFVRCLAMRFIAPWFPEACGRTPGIHGVSGTTSPAGSHTAPRWMARADRRLGEKGERKTGLWLRRQRSSTAASFEPSCRFHRHGKLMSPGHDGRELRVRLAEQVVKHITDGLGEPGQP